MFFLLKKADSVVLFVAENFLHRYSFNFGLIAKRTCCSCFLFQFFFFENCFLKKSSQCFDFQLLTNKTRLKEISVFCIPLIFLSFLKKKFKTSEKIDDPLGLTNSCHINSNAFFSFQQKKS